MNNKSTPRDVFSHLLLMIALYASVASFIAVLFQYINAAFPHDIDFSYNRITDIIRSSMANLIIMWPVFIFMSWIIEKHNLKHPQKRDIKIRKWLVYLTLFIAAIAIIIDLIALVNNFLDGDFTIKFLLKLLAVLITAGCVFSYYLWDLKKSREEKPRIPRIVAYVSSCIIVLVIISGFFILGSPKHQRNLRFDESRVNDLSIIQSEIINYWINKDQLPKTFNDLEDSITGFVSPTDPETNNNYEYNVVNDLEFELCAVFKTSNINIDSGKQEYKYYRAYKQKWEHDAGKVCFKRTIDPDLYTKDAIMVPEKIWRD